VADLPPEDQPDTVSIGPVENIPIIHDDDPRFEEERAVWSAARKRAQAMHSPDELISGLSDADWRVRHEVVDRLTARGKDDPRTIPALLRAVLHDPAWEVRDAAVMAVGWFEDDRVTEALRAATSDPHPEVRWSAEFKLAQRT
jgi:HEAT repeat protein